MRRGFLSQSLLTLAPTIIEEFAIPDNQLTACTLGGPFGLDEEPHSLPTRACKGRKTTHRRLAGAWENPTNLLRLDYSSFRRKAKDQVVAVRLYLARKCLPTALPSRLTEPALHLNGIVCRDLGPSGEFHYQLS